MSREVERHRWLAVLALALGAWLVLSSIAEAQRRGGRFGSRSFRSSGSRSSGSGRRSSFGRRSSSSRSGGSATPTVRRSAIGFVVPVPSATSGPSLGEPATTSDERDARSGTGAGAFFEVGCGSSCCLFFSLGLLSWVFGYDKARRDAGRAAALARGPPAGLGGPRPGHCEVRRISIGFDWTVRRQLQAILDHMANTLPLDGSEGRRQGAAAVGRALYDAMGGARYATYQSLRVDTSGAEAEFARMATTLAARYQHERGQAGPAMAAHRHEGEGLVVVSVLVATDAPMDPLPPNTDAASVGHALGTLASIRAREVYALEVIWSPEAEQDRMSSLELEANYPELQRLDAQPGLGRVVCTYCRAPYPAELGRCPACGAPRA